jgi:hypothetical protein
MDISFEKEKEGNVYNKDNKENPVDRIGFADITDYLGSIDQVIYGYEIVPCPELDKKEIFRDHIEQQRVGDGETDNPRNRPEIECPVRGKYRVDDKRYGQIAEGNAIEEEPAPINLRQQERARFQTGKGLAEQDGPGYQGKG